MNPVESSYDAFFSLTLIAVAGIVLVLVAMVIVGSAFVLKRAGKRPWLAMVPVVNTWALARVASRDSGLALPVAAAVSSAVYEAMNLAAHVTSQAYVTGGAGLLSDPAFSAAYLAAAAVSMACGVIVCAGLSRRFGHGVPMTLGLVFLPPFFYLALGLEGR